MKKFLLSSSLGLAAFAAHPAFADCAEAPINTYTCTGADVDGLADNDPGVLVTVEATATVSKTTGEAIQVRGTGASVTNNGRIDGTLGDVEGIDGRTGLTVINNGTITTKNRGIDTRGFDGLTLTNSGTISSQNKAVRAGFVEATRLFGDNNTIVNSGLIESLGNEGIEGADTNTVTNTVTGVIAALDDAIQIDENGKIINHGLIENRGGALDEAQDAIDIDSGYIRNGATGIIRSTFGDAIDFDQGDADAIIDNYGLITGQIGVLVEKGGGIDPANISGQLINNWGTIVGTSGLALDLGAGEDRLNLFAGAAIKGGADFGLDDDAFSISGLLTGSVGMGGLFDGNRGIDLLAFDSYSFSDIVSVFLGVDDTYNVRLDAGAGTLSLFLRSWDAFAFTDGDYSEDQVKALAAVPLPATGLLLIAGLGLLAGLRRRR